MSEEEEDEEEEEERPNEGVEEKGEDDEGDGDDMLNESLLRPRETPIEGADVDDEGDMKAVRTCKGKTAAISGMSMRADSIARSATSTPTGGRL